MLILASVFAGCKKDESPESAEDMTKTIEERIQERIPAQYIEELKKLGMKFYAGETPPSIEGTYELSPVIYMATNYEREKMFLGSSVAKIVFKFGAHKNNEITFQQIDDETKTTMDIKGSIITGEDNHFSVYGVHKYDFDGGYVTFGYLISGRKESVGIVPFDYAMVVLDKKNDGGAAKPIGTISLYRDPIASPI